MSSPMTIPFLNLRKLYQDHREEFQAAMSNVLDQGAYIGGAELTKFETDFAKWVGEGNFCVGSANGTDAITVAAKSLELSPGAEAIAPAMTYIATVAGLLQAGLNVKLVDIDPKTYLIDTNALAKAVTANTKVLAPVHLYGQMAPMDQIRTIADQHGLKVYEDSAQAHGAKWKGKPVGTWGDIVTYSFYPGKNLGAFGDAGAIVSRNEKLIERCRALGNQGGIKKYEHHFLGYNSRLDNLQAAALNVKLKYIDGWNDSRRRVARNYGEILGGIAGLQLPVESPDAKHVYHLYVVQVEKRVDFQKFLKDRGVDSGIHYPNAIHELPAFANLSFAKESFPNATRLAQHGVSLPMCPTLTDEQVAYVGDTVRAYFGKN